MNSPSSAIPALPTALSQEEPVRSQLGMFLDILNSYLGVFVIAFLVTIAAPPIMRRLAISHGIIDRPDETRKQHRVPIAYLGGAAGFLG